VVTGAPGTASKLADGLKSYGAAKIYVAESDAVDKYLGGVQVAVLESLIASASPAAVLIAASADGKEIAGRLAVRTDSGLLTDVVGSTGTGPRSTPSSVAPSWSPPRRTPHTR